MLDYNPEGKFWFPPCYKYSGVDSQIIKIQEEANEVHDAFVGHEGVDRIIEETLDCIAACETLLWNLALEQGELGEWINGVLIKNMNREGYYTVEDIERWRTHSG